MNHDPKESLVKGDILHSDGLRVLLFSSDESLNILARLRLFYVMEHSGYVLISGIKCLSSVLNLEIILLFLFVLVFFQIKKRRSYDDFFNLLKDALEHPSRNLELSAEWMMSDFEHNIRASWESIFPGITGKGCHFHYAKVCIMSLLVIFH